MRIGLFTRNPRAWCSAKLVSAMRRRGIVPICFRFSDLMARIACKPEVTIDGGVDALEELSAILIRPIGRGSLDETIFRLDLLRRLKRLGLPIVNSPSSIEKAVDKYRALTILEENNIPVPRTIVVEDPRKALDAFHELNGDVVIKPIFGSRGLGITRITDSEVAMRIFKALSFIHSVLYIQEFIHHGTRDIRAFVVGNRVIAAMYRIATGWKTNVSQGARSIQLKPTKEIKDLAVNAAKSLGCEVAGVDIMKGPEGYVVNEINSQPGFKGLQSTTSLDIADEIVSFLMSKVKS